MDLRLEAIVEGPEDAETLFFLQGWPDDATLWDASVAALSSRYRCVRTTMPNFDGQRTAPWGYSNDEIVRALAELLERVSNARPVTMIQHDWGCFWGYRVYGQHPHLIGRIVALDIGGHVEPSAGAMLGVVAYQWWLIGAFLLGGPIGDWMTRSLASAMNAPLAGPQVHAGMNYPYRNAWWDLARGRGRAEGLSMWPEVPILFVYGKKKPFPFHSERWTEWVEGRGGKVVGLDCDHWVSRDTAFQGILDEWLEASAAGTEASAIA